MATQETCQHCGGAVDRTDKVCPHCQKSLTAVAAGRPGVGVPTSTTLLLLFGVGAVGIGAMTLSQATSGVGLICAGCFLAVWGRIFQAAAHHREAVAAISNREQ